MDGDGLSTPTAIAWLPCGLSTSNRLVQPLGQWWSAVLSSRRERTERSNVGIALLFLGRNAKGVGIPSTPVIRLPDRVAKVNGRGIGLPDLGVVEAREID